MSGRLPTRPRPATTFKGSSRTRGTLARWCQFDRTLLGEVNGLRGTHLQCHIGADAVSLSNLGARSPGWTSLLPGSSRCAALSAEPGRSSRTTQLSRLWGQMTKHRRGEWSLTDRPGNWPPATEFRPSKRSDNCRLGACLAILGSAAEPVPQSWHGPGSRLGAGRICPDRRRPLTPRPNWCSMARPARRSGIASYVRRDFSLWVNPD